MAVSLLLNDVHSGLNPTWVREVCRPESVAEVVATVQRARSSGCRLSVAGARHSMGGQPFAVDSIHLDMRSLNRLLALDSSKGLARVEAGMNWTELLSALEAAQTGHGVFWTFIQKQTGADDLTIGGAVSSNIHGRGLAWGPFVQDVESVTLVDAQACVRRLSREENSDLFRLVVGGYGMFGVVVEVELRLRPRQALQRQVEITHIQGLSQRVESRVREGYILGDFQFCPDPASPHFLQEGVFACYRPAPFMDEPVSHALLNPKAWRRLITLAHSDMPSAWSEYTAHYQRTHGQSYFSDHAQLSHYDPDYVGRIAEALPEISPGSLMISELYVPRELLEDFMAACKRDFLCHQTQVIYGTIRFIQKDDETFLPWARQNYACIVFNLRVIHTDEGLAQAQGAFRRLIDRALERGGSFYLTYHRWATRQQLLEAYPHLPAFVQSKNHHDPEGLFQSEWFRYVDSLLREGGME